jgi:imidazole glycerol-phosphate synthase subunit HisH
MIGIVDYNMGNIQSVVNAFGYLGFECRIVTDAAGLDSVDKIVLPGVGAFGEAMSKLHGRGLIDGLHKNVRSDKKPFLGICLGMQLICKESFEFGHFDGLAWVNASVRKFEPELHVRVPHVGWNDLIIKRANPYIVPAPDTGLDVYFVHSYYVDCADPADSIANCFYGREFAAAIQKENILATQFHPEKSQKIGLDILKKFAAN